MFCACTPSLNRMRFEILNFILCWTSSKKLYLTFTDNGPRQGWAKIQNTRRQDFSARRTLLKIEPKMNIKMKKKMRMKMKTTATEKLCLLENLTLWIFGNIYMPSTHNYIDCIFVRIVIHLPHPRPRSRCHRRRWLGPLLHLIFAHGSCKQRSMSA